MNKKIVSALWVYPVKSLGGMAIQTAKVLPKGFVFDRRWMLVDEQNRFMTQRVYPQMALFKIYFDGRHFSIHYSSEIIELPFTTDGDPIAAVVWNDAVDVFEVSNKHSEWFSSILGIRCRMVAFPEQNPRRVDPRYSINENHVSLADAYPFLIIGQESLNDLNNRLKESVPMNRFRPNIVFTGGEPYEEDRWKKFRIGKNRFEAVKLCSRCVMTTVEQETGVKEGVEPLATLARYRREENNVYFGQNLIALDYHEISVGDDITLE